MNFRNLYVVELLSCITGSKLLVRCTPGVHPFIKDLSCLFYRIFVNQFCFECRGETYTETVDCFKWIKKEGKGIYMWLK